MVDKDFCLSSYIAYRYIYKDDTDFYVGMKHCNNKPLSKESRIIVKSTIDINNEIQKQIDELYKQYSRIGILLSGGMDSAILASYLKPGSNAYTFSATISTVYNDDIARSKEYCQKLKLNQHFVDISFDDYKKYTPIVMKEKCAPVHSIEPQIYKATLFAKECGDEIVIIGESSDLIFGGMDKLLAKDWNYEDFINRYIFLKPESVLVHPVNVKDLFEDYRLPDDKIDFMRFIDEIFSVESSNSYMNAFKTAQMPYYDPYAKLIMAEKLDLNRVRNGESKYLIRELFKMKYPEISVPEKIPMPRPVDTIFKEWKGPTREEFKNNINMDELTGNQKWQLWCAELFLNIFDR